MAKQGERTKTYDEPEPIVVPVIIPVTAPVRELVTVR